MAAIGQTLRDARNARNVSLEQVAQETRISLRFLEALEEEDFKVLPAPVYVRGFLRSYANYLGLDAQPLVEELQRMEDGAAASPRRADPFQPSRGVHPLPTSVIVEGDDVYPGGEPADEEGYEAWDAEEPDGWDEGVISYPAQNLPRRGVGVSGVLNERTTDTSGITRIAMLVAGGAIIVVIVLAGLLLLSGGDENQAAAPQATETTTATLASGTVIEVGSPTVGATQPGGTDTTPSPAETTTPAAAETATGATPTATESNSDANPTAAPAQATATAAATATPTTAAQPTATFTPMPTATPTVIPHPHEFNECIATNNECPAGSLVVCAPNGFFVDVAPYGTWPSSWPVHPFTTVSQAKTVCQ